MSIEGAHSTTEPQRVGRFVVLRRLGAGAMGIVYSAYDEELGRRVAIKILQIDPHDSLRRARLQREAQAMARLSHPNVVHIYEVGEYDGQIYIAMEHIAGRTLSAWLGEARRSWQEILAVFLQVGAGLAAAHRASLVHRDVKPDNILLGKDGHAVIADFGLARHDSPVAPVAPVASVIDDTATLDIDDPVDEQNIRLTDPHTLIGTPAYMPPEQHLGKLVDARSDQYSFCVSLYESLHGVLPFTADTRAGLVLQITRGALPAWKRGGRVPRWLDRTIARGLAADPAARWESMDALLAALSRTTWRRRWRIAVAVAFGAVLATLVNVVVQRTIAGVQACEDIDLKVTRIWGASERKAVEAALLATGLSHAPDTWERVEAGLDIYTSRWKTTYLDVCEGTTARSEQASSLLRLKLTCLDRQLSELRALLQVLASADATIAENAVYAVASLPDQQECTDVARLERASEVTGEATLEQIATLQEQMTNARALERAGHYQRALDSTLAAQALARRFDDGPYRSRALLLQGELLDRLGKYTLAEQALVDAYWTAEAHADDDVKLGAATVLVSVAEQQARYSEGHQWGRAGLAIVQRTRLQTAQHAELLNALGGLAISEGKLDAASMHHAEALQLRRQIFGEAHPTVATSLNNLGIVYDLRRHHPRALEYYQRALALQERVLGEEHPLLSSPLYNIGLTYYTLGDFEPARIAFERALQINRANLGDQHPKLAMTMLGLGEVHRSTHTYARAEELNASALAIFERAHGAGHPMCAYASMNLGRVLLETGRPQQAIPRFERALAIWARNLAGPQEMAEARAALARARWQSTGDRDAARTLARMAAQDFRRATPPNETEAAELEAWIATLR